MSRVTPIPKAPKLRVFQSFDEAADAQDAQSKVVYAEKMLFYDPPLFDRRMDDTVDIFLFGSFFSGMECLGFSSSQKR